MIKGITHAHLGPIWYHSEPSDFRSPLFPKPVTGHELFCHFLQQPGSTKVLTISFFRLFLKEKVGLERGNQSNANCRSQKQTSLIANWLKTIMALIQQNLQLSVKKSK